MKRTLSITILLSILCLAVFVGCNSDTEHGLYYQLANSSEASSITIYQVIWSDTATHTYIYRNDQGIYKFYNGQHELLVKNTSSMKVKGAYASDVDTIYFFDQISGKLYKYGTTEPLGTFAELYPNGFVMQGTGTEKKLYHVNDLATEVKDCAGVSKVLTSGNYILLDLGTTKEVWKVGSSSATISISTSDTLNGFLAVSDSEMYYTVDSTTLCKQDGTTVKTLSQVQQTTAYNGIKVPMFKSGDNVYLKFGSIFADKDGNETLKGWALNIATAEVVYASPDGTVIATESSGLYEVNVSDNTNKKVF